MIIKNAQFITSAQKLSQCPDFGLPEIALLGRSNVGNPPSSILLQTIQNLQKPVTNQVKQGS